MKPILTLLFSVFFIGNLLAQSDSLTILRNIDSLNNKIVDLEGKLDTLQAESSQFLQESESIKNTQSILDREYRQLNNEFAAYKQQTAKQIDSLQEVNYTNIQTTAQELGVKIEDAQKSANEGITDLNKTISRNTLYWIIAILVVALLVLLVFVLLRKQIFKQKTDLDSNLQDTRKALEEEGVKLDIKLAEILEKQLTIINEQQKKESKTKPSEIDHSLVLKVADRLISMEKNLSRMDENTKGLKQLKRAVQNIKDNFASNNYEIVEMLGKPFNDGMKVSANFIPDENLESGQQIITRIIKPQVNYKGVMIQSAQIEVSQG